MHYCQIMDIHAYFFMVRASKILPKNHVNCDSFSTFLKNYMHDIMTYLSRGVRIVATRSTKTQPRISICMFGYVSVLALCAHLSTVGFDLRFVSVRFVTAQSTKTQALHSDMSKWQMGVRWVSDRGTLS